MSPLHRPKGRVNPALFKTQTAAKTAPKWSFKNPFAKKTGPPELKMRKQDRSYIFSKPWGKYQRT